MKQITLFITVVLVIILLSGCGSSNSFDTENTTADRSNSTQADTDTIKKTDIETTTGQNSTTPEATGVLEYEAHIGDSVSAIKELWKNSISTTEYDDAVIWKDRNGYYIACAGEDGDTIYATVLFSDDLELLEAVGLEPIEPIDQMEEWLGKTEDEFIALYGPYHFHQLSHDVHKPSYISKNGNIYHIEIERGTIVSMYCGAINWRHYSYCSTATPEETEKVECDVQIGDSFRTTKESLGSSIFSLFNDCVIWRDHKGYHIACVGEDRDSVSQLRDTIYAVVLFSDELELLEADGLDPIEPIIHLEEWLGKTEDEFIAMYGPYHFQPGSGLYMPSYISEDGHVYWMDVELGVIVGMHSYSIDGTSVSKNYLYPEFGSH